MTQEEYGNTYQIAHFRTVKFLISRGASVTVAAELAQSASAKGWERIAQLRETSMIVRWINTIALNEYRRYITREGSHTVEPPNDSAAVAYINLAAIDVARILAFCTPGDRLLLEAQLNGNTPREIADKFGITETAARIRFLKARRSAKRAVANTGQ